MAGHIEKLGKQRYRVRIFLGRDPNGKVLRHDKVIRGTLKDAERYRNAVLRDKDLGVHVEPAKTPLNEFLNDWLKSEKKNLRQRTYDDYEERLNWYIREPLGHHPMDQITPLMVQKVLDDLADRLGPRSVRYAHFVLSKALRQAVKWRMLQVNPAAEVTLPKRSRKRKVKAFDLDLVRDFREVATTDRHRAWWELMLGSGMRPEESLGLQWPHVLWGSNAVRVEQALIRPKGGGWKFEPPKTEEGFRTIEMPPPVMEVLRAHRTEQLEQRLAAGAAYQDHNLVFATPLGTPLSGTHLGGPRHFKRLLRLIGGRKLAAARERAGLTRRDLGLRLGRDARVARQLEEGKPVRLTDEQVRTLSIALGLEEGQVRADLGLALRFNLYCLRHTYATLSLLAGVDLLTVSRNLGHASITITADIYGHLLPAMREQAAVKLTRLIWG